MDLFDVKDILENGEDSPRKRKEGTIERWKITGNKTYEVVVVKDYNDFFKQDVWLITHIGKFGLKHNKG